MLTAALLPDASAALLLGGSGVLWRTDLRSHAETDLLEVPSPLEVDVLAVLSDGAVFAVAAEFDVAVFDAHSGRELLRLAGDASRVKDVVFSDDGWQIATAEANGLIRLWDRRSGVCERVLPGPDAPVLKVEFVDGHRRLASVTSAPDASVYLWDAASGERLWRAVVDRYGLLALAVSPDGALAATGGHDRTVDLWDLRRQVRSGVLSGHTGLIWALRFSPDGATLVSAADDGTIRFWDLATRSLVRTIEIGRMDPAAQ